MNVSNQLYINLGVTCIRALYARDGPICLNFERGTGTYSDHDENTFK